ncbi:YraN family protein [Paralimibaculum aggregatum]|uniref:UPF0102 protein LNKW23_34060 n=1 Tax=Paralimibaculum aggregatum TaxID=3036245 RepID=A0ABQ6LMJ8_9RHOB|nr:YraN family protein [Limibaculum sp. NKW23]GMG84192.1 YraN family protein [Limibaculum sp. NKW23]
MTDGRRFHAGLAAEEIAAARYAAEGGEVLASRWRVPEGEIDLVVRLGTLTVFVEVKQRRRSGPDSPVSPRQWARIAAAASRWIAAHPDPAVTGYRFDAALIDGAGRLELVADAWRPGGG